MEISKNMLCIACKILAETYKITRGRCHLQNILQQGSMLFSELELKKRNYINIVNKFTLAVLLRKEFLKLLFQAVEDSWKILVNCELQK